jgi:hypothetical protein
MDASRLSCKVRVEPSAHWQQSQAIAPTPTLWTRNTISPVRHHELDNRSRRIEDLDMAWTWAPNARHDLLHTSGQNPLYFPTRTSFHFNFYVLQGAWQLAIERVLLMIGWNCLGRAPSQRKGRLSTHNEGKICDRYQLELADEGAACASVQSACEESVQPSETRQSSIVDPFQIICGPSHFSAIWCSFMSGFFTIPEEIRNQCCYCRIRSASNHHRLSKSGYEAGFRQEIWKGPPACGRRRYTRFHTWTL